MTKEELKAKITEYVGLAKLLAGLTATEMDDKIVAKLETILTNDAVLNLLLLLLGKLNVGELDAIVYAAYGEAVANVSKFKAAGPGFTIPPVLMDLIVKILMNILQKWLGS